MIMGGRAFTWVAPLFERATLQRPGKRREPHARHHAGTPLLARLAFVIHDLHVVVSTAPKSQSRPPDWQFATGMIACRGQEQTFRMGCQQRCNTRASGVGTSRPVG